MKKARQVVNCSDEVLCVYNVERSFYDELYGPNGMGKKYSRLFFNLLLRQGLTYRKKRLTPFVAAEGRWERQELLY
ncbi:MAG: hypothetical protein ACOCVH_01695 [Verrucomicrobiota bacterium]